MEDLKETQYFDEDALPDVAPLDYGENYFNEEGNSYVVKVGGESNNYSSPPMHVGIKSYQF